MKLPKVTEIIVAPEKITGYLLNIAHPDGSSKARLFVHFGFTLQKWQELAESLRRHAQSGTVTAVTTSPYGVRYSVDGMLETLDGRGINFRSVWIVETGSSVLRLITAHPLQEVNHGS